MGYIDRRPSGRWRARYRDPEGRERSQTFDRKGDAERFLQRNGADLQRGEWIDPALRRVLFAEWADQWWQTTARLRPSTRRGYWQILQNHVLPEFGDRTAGLVGLHGRGALRGHQARRGRARAQENPGLCLVISLVMQAAIRSGPVGTILRPAITSRSAAGASDRAMS